jgi:hypothetical protein
MVVTDMQKEIERRLSAPFKESEILWRIGRAGVKDGKPWAKCLAYVDARAAQGRFDDVVGPLGWSVRTHPIFSKDELVGWTCMINVNVSTEHERLSADKEDGADLTDIEGFKGGISKAFVRAASAWGVGRYLYNLPEGYVREIVTQRPADVRAWEYQPASNNRGVPEFWWKPPLLPKEFLPTTEQGPVAPKAATPVAAAPKAAEKPVTPTQTGLALDGLKSLVDASRVHNWTPVQVNAYCRERFKKESARELEPDQLAIVIDVVRRFSVTDAQATIGPGNG